MEQKKKARPQERRSRKFERETPRRKRPQMEAEPKRRSDSLNATVAKTSAGAVEYVPVARIGNIAQTLKKLKEKGFWVAGADMDGEKAYYEADLTGPLVLVVGSEGRGMSRLTKEACDFIVSMPMVGRINSLNASVAGSILMYESMRQRLQKKG